MQGGSRHWNLTKGPSKWCKHETCRKPPRASRHTDNCATRSAPSSSSRSCRVSAQEYNNILRQDYNNSVRVISSKPFIISTRDYAYLNIEVFPISCCTSISMPTMSFWAKWWDPWARNWRMENSLGKALRSMISWRRWWTSGGIVSSQWWRIARKGGSSRRPWSGYMPIREISILELISMKTQSNTTKKSSSSGKFPDIQTKDSKSSKSFRICKNLISV